ncbi:hypothetical protein LTR08_004729 [Meristemomyces frigidus]|nr:hypothetical protein LTR08_004729 [Meristemomyces frigidus]
MSSVSSSSEKCRLLELPTELREQIWIFTVTEWIPTKEEHNGPSGRGSQPPMLQRNPVRIDRFNKPLPPPITRASILTRNETLPLYYAYNTFECWRPLFWVNNWSQSTFIDWLTSLTAERCWWIEDITLLYKHEAELDHDIEEGLTDLGIELQPGVISSKRELTELEMGHLIMGLPKHFGKQGRRNRWLA